MIEEQIIKKYIKGDADPEEIKAVVEWLDSDESHLQELNQLRKLYHITLFNEVPSEKKAPQEKKWFHLRKTVLTLVKIAAVFFIFLMGNYWIRKTETTYSQTFFVPPGQRAELLLPDSSIIWLNAQTKITYPSDFGKNNRELTLDGEAYFKVKKKSGQQFTVKTKEANIYVVGTEFNVIAYRNTPLTEISLLSGSIEVVSSATPTKKIVMKPNDLVRIGNKEIQSALIKDYDYYRWKEGLLCFNNEPLENIMRKLELYYDTRIEVKKNNLLKFRYTGKFRTKDGIEHILKVLQIEHKFIYTIDKNLNRITIK